MWVCLVGFSFHSISLSFPSICPCRPLYLFLHSYYSLSVSFLLSVTAWAKEQAPHVLAEQDRLKELRRAALASALGTDQDKDEDSHDS